jgi:hypothetical protein
MSSLVEKSDISVSKDLVKEYWNWLLNKEVVVDNPIKDVKVDGKSRRIFFMRPAYDYANRWEVNPDSGLPNITRKNIPINRVGQSTDTIYEFRGSTIFLPVIDSCLCDFERDASGMPLTKDFINKILSTENEDVLKNIQLGRVRSMIRRLDNGKKDYEDIVDINGLKNYLFPRLLSDIEPFDLHVDENSKLAQSLEFEFPKGKDTKASAQGIYLLFDIKNKGRYQIRSSAEGVRGYTANMNYQIEVEK